MTRSRLLLTLAALLVIETGVFAVYYNDLLYLRTPVAEMLDGEAADFAAEAETALGRDALTLRHLDRIADGAAGFGLPDLERRALERRLAEDPENRGTQVRLADVLRRQGDYTRAEQLLLDLLEASR